MLHSFFSRDVGRIWRVAEAMEVGMLLPLSSFTSAQTCLRHGRCQYVGELPGWYGKI